MTVNNDNTLGVLTHSGSNRYPRYELIWMFQDKYSDHFIQSVEMVFGKGDCTNTGRVYKLKEGDNIKRKAIELRKMIREYHRLQD